MNTLFAPAEIGAATSAAKIATARARRKVEPRTTPRAGALSYIDTRGSLRKGLRDYRLIEATTGRGMGRASGYARENIQ